MTPQPHRIALILTACACLSLTARAYDGTLFGASVWDTCDNGVLSYVDEAYQAYRDHRADPRFQDIRFADGSWAMLEGAIDRTQTLPDVTISSHAGAIVDICWDLGNDRNVCISFPVSYDVVNSGTRGQIEDRFISALRQYSVSERRTPPTYPAEALTQIDEGLYMHPGMSYVIPSVNTNTYLWYDEAGEMQYVVDPKFPACTLANMINAGVGYAADVDITFIKHEYGTTEDLTVPLETLVQYCLSQNCQVYWGLSRTEQNTLSGALFCHNPVQGYNHVLRLTCDPAQMGDFDFTLRGRMSLYVPVNNIESLFE